jgi:hypothetical protein
MATIQVFGTDAATLHQVEHLVHDDAGWHYLENLTGQGAIGHNSPVGAAGNSSMATAIISGSVMSPYPGYASELFEVEFDGAGRQVGPNQALDTPWYTAIDCAYLGTELHVFVVDQFGVDLVHAVRSAPGPGATTWSAFRGSEAPGGQIVAISTAGAGIDGKPEVYVVGRNGGLWRGRPGHFPHVFSFHDVAAESGLPVQLISIAVARQGTDLHVFGIAPGGADIWHAVCHADGSWTKFRGWEAPGGLTALCAENAILGEQLPPVFVAARPSGLWQLVPGHGTPGSIQFHDVAAEIAPPSTPHPTPHAGAFASLACARVA